MTPAATQTVFLAWELGAGRGHVERLLPIAGALMDRGCRVICVLRDMTVLKDMTIPVRWSGRLSFVPAPTFRHVAPPTPPGASLAEVLAGNGLADERLMRPVVAAWEKLLARYRPQVVVADAAPSLSIAAAGLVPVIAIGNGWTLPPAGAVAHDRCSPDRKAMAARCAAAVAATASRIAAGRDALAFSDILRGERSFVFCVPSLDPYRVQRSDEFYWPPEIAPPGPSRQHRGQVVVYLPGNHPVADVVVEGVAAAGLPLKAYFPGGGAPSAATPLRLEAEIPKAKVMVHHGGLGMAIWGMAHDVPQLICPADLEKALVADAVKEAGHGGAFGLTAQPQGMAAALRYASELRPPPIDFAGMRTASPQDTLSVLVDAIMAAA